MCQFPFTRLPSELQGHVLQFVSTRDLLSLAKVEELNLRNWYQIVTNHEARNLSYFKDLPLDVISLDDVVQGGTNGKVQLCEIFIGEGWPDDDLPNILQFFKTSRTITYINGKHFRDYFSQDHPQAQETIDLLKSMVNSRFIFDDFEDFESAFFRLQSEALPTNIIELIDIDQLTLNVHPIDKGDEIDNHGSCPNLDKLRVKDCSYIMMEDFTMDIVPSREVVEFESLEADSLYYTSSSPKHFKDLHFEHYRELILEVVGFENIQLPSCNLLHLRPPQKSRSNASHDLRTVKNILAPSLQVFILNLKESDCFPQLENFNTSEALRTVSVLSSSSDGKKPNFKATSEELEFLKSVKTLHLELLGYEILSLVTLTNLRKLALFDCSHFPDISGYKSLEELELYGDEEKKDAVRLSDWKLPTSLVHISICKIDIEDISEPVELNGIGTFKIITHYDEEDPNLDTLVVGLILPDIERLEFHQEVSEFEDFPEDFVPRTLRVLNVDHSKVTTTKFELIE